MDDRLGSLERKVDQLSAAMADLQGRLEQLESHGVAALGGARRSPRPDTTGAGLEAVSEDSAVDVLALVGRTCLVLGGAYLLRAVTDAGTLPRTGGALLGIAYAIAWLWLADRQAVVRGPLAAAFYGAASVLIAFPLIWETTVSFHLLTPTAAAAALTAITSLVLVVSWRRRLQGLAWIITVAGLLAAPLFMMAAGSAVPFGFYLTFLGVATLWMGYSLDWIWLRWPVAFAVDLSVLVMAGSVTGVWQRQGASGVMVLQLTLFAGYLVSVAARTIWRSRDVIPFEVVQMLALLVVAFGGAAYVMLSTGAGATVLGVASLVFGIGSYAVAFAFVDWRRGHWKNFVFYTSLGLVFILAGTALTVGFAGQAIAWSCLALVSAFLGHRYATVALWPHTAVYLLAAAGMGGLLSQLSDAFLGPESRAWVALSWPAIAALVAAGVCCRIPVPPLGGALQRWARLPKLVVVVTLLLGAGGVLIGLAVPVLSAPPGAGADLAIVAGVRTLVLAAAALLLAWLGGSGIFAEGRWLTYVVLVLGGLKLLLSDFLAGRPSTLFVSLALYGVALILAPKWARRVRARHEPALREVQGVH